MAIRVWTRPTDASRTGGAWVDYDEHELDITLDGRMIATFAPGNWHHVEWTEAARS